MIDVLLFFANATTSPLSLKHVAYSSCREEANIEHNANSYILENANMDRLIINLSKKIIKKSYLHQPSWTPVSLLP